MISPRLVPVRLHLRPRSRHAAVGCTRPAHSSHPRTVSGDGEPSRRSSTDPALSRPFSPPPPPEVRLVTLTGMFRPFSAVGFYAGGSILTRRGGRGCGRRASRARGAWWRWGGWRPGRRISPRGPRPGIPPGMSCHLCSRCSLFRCQCKRMH